MDANEFMKTVKPASRQRSPLHQHADAISRLRVAGYTYDQILLYLKEQGIVVSKTRLCNFVKDMASPRAAASVTTGHRRKETTSARVAAPIPTPAIHRPGDPTPEQLEEFARLSQQGLTKKDQ